MGLGCPVGPGQNQDLDRKGVFRLGTCALGLEMRKRQRKDKVTLS